MSTMLTNVSGPAKHDTSWCVPMQPTRDRAKRPRKTSSNQHGQSTKSVPPETEDVVEKLVIAQRPAAEIQVVPQARPVSKTGMLAEQWKSTGPITPKAVSPPTSHTHNEAPRQPKQYPGIRQALPGMTKDPRNSEVSKAIASKKSFERPTPVNTSVAQSHEVKQAVPSSPGPQNRIPSTGSRATVMEVAQALNEHAASTNAAKVTTQSHSVVEERMAAEKEETRSPVLRQTLSPGTSEKRKSSYDSFVTLPPLKEEATPAPSPANTFSRSDGRAVATRQDSDNVQEQHGDKDSGVVTLGHFPNDVFLSPVD